MNQFINQIGTLVLIALIIITGRALAENTTSLENTALENTALENIVVSATRSDINSLLTGKSISVINQQDIVSSGAINVVDVLRNVAGIQVIDNFGNGARTLVSLRGFGATSGSNTLVLVDGRRLNNSDLGAPEFNTVSLKDIERIEIIKGSAGALFGDNAVGGVINIITQKPQDFAANAQISIGSDEAESYQLSLTDQLANGLSYRLTSINQRGNGFRKRNRQELVNYSARLDYQYKNGSVFIENQKVDENLFLPGALTNDQVTNQRRQAQFQNDFNDTDTRAYRIGINQVFTDKLSFLAELTDRDTDIIASLSNTGLSQKRRIQSFTPRFIIDVSDSPLASLVTLGADLDNTQYRLDSAFGTQDTRQQLRSAYLQVVSALGEQFTTTVGYRYGRIENELQDASDFGATFSDRTKFNDQISSYEISINYQVNDRFNLFVRRDGNFRFAKVDEQFISTDTLLGLQTQDGVSYETGINYQAQDLTVSATIYQLELNNEIEFDPSAIGASGFPGANTNLDDTRRRGLILGSQWQINPSLGVRFNYSLVDAEFDQGQLKGHKIPQVARQLATLGVTLNFNQRFLKGLTLYSELQYTGARYSIGDFANQQGEQGGFSLVNLNLNYSQGSYRLSVRCDNLFDKQYNELTALRFDGVKTFFPSPERKFNLSFGYQW